MPSEVGGKVALYLDFENLHISVYEHEHGQGSYQYVRGKVQDPVVQLGAIMDHVATIGDVVINKAYANWQWFGQYRHDLNEYGINLIQLFPIGGKNGADIRLSLDAMEDIQHYAHITHVVLVSSDRDFMSLAQKIKQSGRTIIGIGVEENVNPFWVKACNEFKFYESLSARRRPAGSAPGAGGFELSAKDVKNLLLNALSRLARRRVDGVVESTALKAMVQRIDPTFDETRLGYASFAQLLMQFPDIVKVVDSTNGGHLTMAEVPQSAPASSPSERPRGKTPPLDDIFRLNRVWTLPPEWMWPALDLLDSIFEKEVDGIIKSFDEMEAKLIAELNAAGYSGDAELVHKLRGNLWNLRLFRLHGYDVGISLISTEYDMSLRLTYEQALVDRIVKHSSVAIEVEQLIELLYPPEERNMVTRERLQRWMKQFSGS